MAFPICKDCKYESWNSINNGQATEHFCKHQLSEMLNLVTGQIKNRPCYEMRENHLLCGEEGKYFERRNVDADNDLHAKGE